jgi:hypothetical protein
MRDEPNTVERPAASAARTPGRPEVVDRATWQAELDAVLQHAD